MVIVPIFLISLGVTLIGAEEVNPCDPTGQTPYDYKQALCMSILFYEAQRSGNLTGDERFPWRGDSALLDGSDNNLDLSGGYYDAGDHVKFGFPLAYTITTLAWSLLSFRAGYETADQVEYAEQAIRWGSDYLLKAHSGNLTLWGQVGQGDVDHAYWGRPEDMTMERPSMKIDSTAPGSELAAGTASALAAAARVFQVTDPDHAKECLEVARNLFELADKYRENYHNSITDAQDFYKSWSGYGDELAVASLWLFRNTGESYYFHKSLDFWTEFNVQYNANGYGWDNKYSAAQILYAEEYGGEPYRSTVQTFLETMRNSTHTPGGMVYLGEWGSLRSAVNVAFIALKAADLGIDPDVNKEWATQQINYALGSTGRSFMVGFGINPPQRPHHRSSSCPDPPTSCSDGWAFSQEGPNPHVLFGALVGGPDENDTYVDDRSDYVHNEVALDYNAALTGVLAKMIMLN